MKPTQPVRVAIIGAGGVSSLQYAPALLLDRRAQLVAVCDANPQLANQKALEWGANWVDTDCAALFARAEPFDAVIIATPNDQHVPIALAALKAGKHVLCEKPLGLSSDEVRSLYQVARDSGQVHMTAFTYRFAPSMRFLRHLVHSGSLGQPRHFRSQRFLDWPEPSWGWRQYRERAGAGDLYDMTIHRLDLAVDLLAWEFISAILEQRDAIPSFYDGLVAQRLADAVLQSQREARWIELGLEPR